MQLEIMFYGRNGSAKDVRMVADKSQVTASIYKSCIAKSRRTARILNKIESN